MSVGGWGWGRGTGMVCQSGGEDDQGEDEQGAQAVLLPIEIMPVLEIKVVPDELEEPAPLSIIDRIRNKLTTILGIS